jgi:hypothetical protein
MLAHCAQTAIAWPDVAAIVAVLVVLVVAPLAIVWRGLR